MKGMETTAAHETEGFTLLETLVSLSVFSLVILGLHTVAVSSERTQEVGTRITHVNQNIRATLEIISRDLRMAGSGFAGVPVQTADGSLREVIYPITPGFNPGDEADSVSVLAGLGDAVTVLAEAMESPSSEIICMSADGFEVGDMVVVTDGVHADLFEITAIVEQTNKGRAKLLHAPSRRRNDPDGHSQWPAGGYPAGSRAVKVSRITLKAQEVGGVRRLYRRIDDGEPVLLLDDVRQLTFTYGLGDGTEVRNPSSPGDIHTITVMLEAGLRSGWGLEDRSVVTTTCVRPRSKGGA